jgi:ABC-2 type transport system ATP-binding protein
MTAIQTEDLQKFYGPVHALDGLSLKVEAGSIFGFLGPNGAGKSTTIRLLTGLARPSGGQAWVAGVEISRSRQISSRIGCLPEEPAFYNWMTPVEFLDHVARIFGIKAAERQTRTRQLLEQVGLSEVRKRRIGGFSRGMRQRLGLAQAIYNHPEVLFLDEPVSALDPAGRKEGLDLIRQLRQQSTVFMSTHILADVERVCDTVGIINRGRLVVEARQDELLSRYTIPAFELECDPGCEETFKAWCGSLKTAAWVSSVVLNGSTARLVVKDVAQARQALLARVVEAGLALRRYEIVTPSLEDIFLRLVNGESRPE